MEGEGEWLTIAEAARATGLSEKAIRSRIKRGTVQLRPGRRENDGLAKVLVTPQMRASVVGPDAGSDHGSVQRPVHGLDVRVIELQAELTYLRSDNERLRREVLRATEDGDRRLADARADHRAEVERLHELLRAAVTAQSSAPASTPELTLRWWQRLRW